MEDHRATVCEVEIFNHPNADRLELARPVGTDWQCVVGKNQFKTGDLAVYVPIDSIVPQSFQDKYLSGSKIQLKNGRIKTAKIRGEFSQGLLVPASSEHQLGQDVTDELGITKYEPPPPKWWRDTSIPKSTRKKLKEQAKFVKFVDELFPKYTKIKNHKYWKRILQEGQDVVITEKLHGTNHRCGRIYTGRFKWPWHKKLWRRLTKKNDWLFVVGSHNVTKWYKDGVYHRAAKEAGLDKLGKEWNGFIFYGEVFGHGIQELSYGVPPGKLELRVFDIMFMNEWGQATYLPWDEVVDLCKKAGLQTVPVIYRGPWSDDLVKLADGDSLIPGAKHHREGFVVKPTTEQYHPRLGRIILKRISDTYLLSKNRTDYH